MKATLNLIIVILFVWGSTFAQTANTKPTTITKPTTKPKEDKLELCIIHATDKMTDKEYYIVNKRLIFDEGKKAMSIKASLDGKGKYSMIIVKSIGIGSCNEHDKIIFLFDDDTKQSFIAWNDFNCKGDAYFDLNSNALDKLQKKIKNIMFQNGRSYESLTVDVPPEDADYFIKVKQLIDSNTIVEGHLTSEGGIEKN